MARETTTAGAPIALSERNCSDGMRMDEACSKKKKKKKKRVQKIVHSTTGNGCICKMEIDVSIKVRLAGEDHYQELTIMSNLECKYYRSARGR
jgi:hypothetical protein